MTIELPVMRALLALGPEGPFPLSSQPRWFAHRDGVVRWLSLQAYTEALLSDGAPSERVAAVAATLDRHGCRRVVWASGHGGTPGHVNATWDVRLIATESPAEEVLADLPQDERAAAEPAAPIEILTPRVGVVTAFTRPVPPSKVPVPREAAPWWARCIARELHIDYHHEHLASAALAIGDVLAEVNVTAASKLAAEDGAIRLVDLVAYDLTSTTAERTPS